MPDIPVSGELSRRRRTPVKPKLTNISRPIAGQGDVILFGIAISYLLLGILKSADVIAIDSPVIASFSLAGMFFALSDLTKLGTGSDPLAFRLFCRFFYFASLFISALCLVVVPLSYAYIGWLGSILIPLGDMSALSGMGVIIGIIVINNVLRRRKASSDPKSASPESGLAEQKSTM